MVYEGSGGYVCFEYKGGISDDDTPVAPHARG